MVEESLDWESAEQRAALVLPEELNEPSVTQLPRTQFPMLFPSGLLRVLKYQTPLEEDHGEDPAELPLAGQRAAIRCPQGPWGPSAPAPPLRLATPSSPLTPPRFALTEPGSRACASGWGTGASTAGAGDPPGDAAISHSCACDSGPGVLSPVGRAARVEWARRGAGQPPGTRETGKLRRFLFPKGKNTQSSASLGKRPVSPGGPFWGRLHRSESQRLSR